MNSTSASSSNPSKKIKLTIIPPRQLFVNISSDEYITTTPSPTTTSSSSTPPNAPSKTTSTDQTSSSQENTSSSFHSKLQISPPSSHEPTSPHHLNHLHNNISDQTNFRKIDPLVPRNEGELTSRELVDIVKSRVGYSRSKEGRRGVVHFGKKEKLAPRIDKTLYFIEEPIEIMDREVKKLKRSRIPIVKVRWNYKRGLEFTWKREDFMKAKYLNLFADRVDESTS
nr:putative reverse transcriptase domain-containing protein [Tanacetum cinerariifolium]